MDMAGSNKLEQPFIAFGSKETFMEKFAFQFKKAQSSSDRKNFENY